MTLRSYFVGWKVLALLSNEIYFGHCVHLHSQQRELNVIYQYGITQQRLGSLVFSLERKLIMFPE